MTPSELKYRVEEAGHDRFFFERGSMKFSGDTMRNYGVRSKPVTIETISGPCECWELYRKKPVKYGLSDPAYFDCETFARRFPKR